MIRSVQTGSEDHETLWFGDLQLWTGAANVVFSFPIYCVCPNLTDWISWHVCAIERHRML